MAATPPEPPTRGPEVVADHVPAGTPEPPRTAGRRVRQIGPGILAAAAGVGSGDLVATLIAGSRFGMVLLWAALLGTLLKIALAEGVGRWQVMSGATMLDGWRLLGRWATAFFGVYIVVWGFVYGATAMSAVGLPLNALFGGLSVRYWAMIAGVVGLLLVWFQRYEVFEKFVTVLVGLKFVTVVSVAVLVGVSWSDLASGLVPRLPEGSTIYVLGLIGGVGGTITMASYGYWVAAKRWAGRGWLGMMRLDNAVGYTMTGIFVVAMLIVGAGLLQGTDVTQGDQGLLQLGETLEDRFGGGARLLFLLGFLSVTTSSLLGVWNGVSLLFADFTRTVRMPHGRDIAVGRAAPSPEAAGEGSTYENAVAERSLAFRGYLVWLTVPPMGLLFLDSPFALTLVYGVLGAAFMPFLGISLILLLNSRQRVGDDGRSGWLSNVMLGGSSALFLVLLIQQVRSVLA